MVGFDAMVVADMDDVIAATFVDNCKVLRPNSSANFLNFLSIPSSVVSAGTRKTLFR